MDTASAHVLLRSLPSIDEVLNNPALDGIAETVSHRELVEAARAAVESARADILAGKPHPASFDDIAHETELRARAAGKPSLRRVVNASGVIVHTNLGRSVLADAAQAAVNDVIAGYSTLEYNTDTRARGSRHDHCERLICTLTGAEAAIAVNNNAAAVMMVLAEFARGKEAVVSRGELVEIGGSFRVPDIMEQSGALMREVGATNKTHERDYARACTPNTAMLLKVHPSNFRVIGFTESVSVAALRSVADACSFEGAKPLVYEDQGSGALIDLPCFEQFGEPTVAASLAAGADLVSFSGDKLLGGPQAGIIVGRKELIDRLKAHPLARALRLDKMTLAALEATLRLYLDPDQALREIPTLRMLNENSVVVRARAERLRAALETAVAAEDATFDLVDDIARAGGGALPMLDIPTCCVRVRFHRESATESERYLISRHEPPIVARIRQDDLLLDARTLADSEVPLVVEGLASFFARRPAAH